MENTQKKDLLFSAHISFEWIFRFKEENFPLKNELLEYERMKGGPIINAGLLVSFAYLVLVFAKESDLINDSDIIENLTINDFEIVLDEKGSSNDKSKFLTRLRNAISHANVEIKDKNIILKDRIPNKDFDFEVRIKTKDFGNFMNSVLFNWNESEKIKQINSLRLTD